ncbi:MAG: SMP-30/gluconolactonase/LRE family protein [Nannocystaceae bacterium]|nr:SMP-30/gluconolactonase/LRE family protein [bacterium]
MKAKTTLILCGLVAACSDDGAPVASLGGGSTGADTVTASSTASAGEASGDRTTAGEDDEGPSDSDSTSGGGPAPTGTASATDPSGSGDGSSSGGIDTPDAACPDGPFADTPLSAPSVVAAALPGTSTAVGSGGLVEGPVWWNGALHLSHFWFESQPPPSNLMRYDGATLEVVFEGSGTNGLAIGIQGELLGGDHQTGAITAYDPETNSRTPVVESFEGQRFNSPNDLTVRSDGTIYFTDPSYQAPQPQPQPVTGVYRVDPDGAVERFESSLTQPNGISLSPDESVLYVAHSGGINRYDLQADGNVATPGAPFGDVFAGVDGMAVDCAGNLYATLHSEGRIVVRSPAGDDLGEIQVAPQVTNAAFGGADQQTLYITAGNPDAGNAVYAVELAIPGLPF